MRLAAVTQKLLSQRSYDWFMYECPADRLVGRVGRPCADRQEGAISKSATFFANENTLPTEHGTPQVSSATHRLCAAPTAHSMGTSRSLLSSSHE